MRSKLFTATLMLFLFATFTRAQVPQGINYQAVLRDSTGKIIANQLVGLRFTIVYVSGHGGGAAYEETNTATTDQFGLFTAVVGSGSPVSGTFSQINWLGPDTLLLQVEVDPTGGTNYTNFGSTPFQSVPYAITAGSSPQWSSNGIDIDNNNGSGAVVIYSSVADPLIIGTSQGYNYTLYSTLDTPRGYVGVYNDARGFDIGTVSNDTVGNLNLVTEANPRISITPTGEVGIGTTAPAAQLDVQGNINVGANGGSEAIINFIATGGVSNYIGGYSYGLSFWSGDANGLFINASEAEIEPEYANTTSLGSSSAKFSAVYAVNGTIQTSDARMKKNVNDLNMGLKEVMALRPVSYEWINPAEGDGGKIGFIAQEVEKVVPQAVVHDYISDKEIETIKARKKAVPEIRDPYSMNYSEMIPVLTKAIQEQQAMIEKLQQRIDQLEAGKQ